MTFWFPFIVISAGHRINEQDVLLCSKWDLEPGLEGSWWEEPDT